MENINFKADDEVTNDIFKSLDPSNHNLLTYFRSQIIVDVLGEEADEYENYSEGTLIDGKPSHRTRIPLWKFLLHLLKRDRGHRLVQWCPEDKLSFYLTNPALLSILWGSIKNRRDMTFEKFSRAMRYYYGKNVIEKVHSTKFAYKFVLSRKTRRYIVNLNFEHLDREELLRGASDDVYTKRPYRRRKRAVGRTFSATNSSLRDKVAALREKIMENHAPGISDILSGSKYIAAASTIQRDSSEVFDDDGPPILPRTNGYENPSMVHYPQSLKSSNPPNLISATEFTHTFPLANGISRKYLHSPQIRGLPVNKDNPLSAQNYDIIQYDNVSMERNYSIDTDQPQMESRDSTKTSHGDFNGTAQNGSNYFVDKKRQEKQTHTYLKIPKVRFQNIEQETLPRSLKLSNPREYDKDVIGKHGSYMESPTVRHLSLGSSILRIPLSHDLTKGHTDGYHRAPDTPPSIDENELSSSNFLDVDDKSRMTFDILSFTNRSKVHKETTPYQSPPTTPSSIEDGGMSESETLQQNDEDDKSSLVSLDSVFRAPTMKEPSKVTSPSLRYPVLSTKQSSTSKINLSSTETYLRPLSFDSGSSKESVMFNPGRSHSLPMTPSSITDEEMITLHTSNSNVIKDDAPNEQVKFKARSRYERSSRTSLSLSEDDSISSDVTVTDNDTEKKNLDCKVIGSDKESRFLDLVVDKSSLKELSFIAVPVTEVSNVPKIKRVATKRNVPVEETTEVLEEEKQRGAKVYKKDDSRVEVVCDPFMGANNLNNLEDEDLYYYRNYLYEKYRSLTSCT